MLEELAINRGKPIRDKDKDGFLIFGSPRIEQDEIDEVVDSLKKGWPGTGPKVEKFQNLFKEYVGSKHAVALNSCTAGLYLSLKVLDIKEGDEVITTPMTFVATANVIMHTGAIPVFVDVKKDTLNIDEDLIEKKITKKTKAILPVHMCGRPCNMDKIKDIAKSYNLYLIEDAAHSIEAAYKNQKIGNIGDLTCFSFYSTKNLTTGEGGMVTTNNQAWAEKIKILSLHGLDLDAWSRYSDQKCKTYTAIFPGYKYNMMDLQASLGIHQIKKLENYLKIRENIWKKYNESFKDLPIILPKEEKEENIKHARHLYTPLLALENLKVDRNAVREALYAENIGTGIHFISAHLHPAYKKRFEYEKEDFPNAEFISNRTISLPLSAKLTDKDVEDVINAVRKVVLYYAK